MTALLVLAMIAQCPPGTYCPNPATIAPAWQYYQIQIDGRTVVVPAYYGTNGVLYYDSTKVPPKVEPTPESKPGPTSVIGEAGPGPLNYGLDMEAIQAELASDRNVIQTNDPQLGALLAANDPGSSEDAARLFKPEVKIDVPDLTRPLIIGFAVIAAAILISRRPRS